MKHRQLSVLIAFVVFSLSLAFAQTKDEGTAKKSECPHAAKASLTSTSEKATAPSADKSAKDCTGHVKDASAKTAAHECTDEEKAKCDHAKAGMMKATDKKGCCSDKAKNKEVKASLPETKKETVTDASKESK